MSTQNKYITNLKRQLSEHSDVVPDRERYVLERYYNLDGRGRQTLKVIGQDLGISPSRVRQMRVSAERRLRMAERYPYRVGFPSHLSDDLALHGISAVPSYLPDMVRLCTDLSTKLQLNLVIEHRDVRLRGEYGEWWLVYFRRGRSTRVFIREGDDLSIVLCRLALDALSETERE